MEHHAHYLSINEFDYRPDDSFLHENPLPGLINPLFGAAFKMVGSSVPGYRIVSPHSVTVMRSYAARK